MVRCREQRRHFCVQQEPARGPISVFPVPARYRRVVLDAAAAENTSDPGGNLYGARAMVRAKSGDRPGAEADITTAIHVGKVYGHFHHTAYSIAAVYSVLGDL
jgi:hypothetical protein